VFTGKKSHIHAGNVTCEVGRRLGKRAYAKEKINETTTDNNNMNIRDLYRIVNYFRNVSQPTLNSVKTRRAVGCARTRNILGLNYTAAIARTLS
jgi:hypothetical protein